MEKCGKCGSVIILGPYHLRYELVSNIQSSEVASWKMREQSVSTEIKTKTADVLAYNTLPTAKLKGQPIRLRYAFYTCDNCGFTEQYIDPIFKHRLEEEEKRKKQEEQKRNENRFCDMCGKPMLTRKCVNCG